MGKIQKIEHLDEKEISILIQDIKDVLEGNIPIFSIDTYDIVAFCFPFTYNNIKDLDEVAFDYKGYRYIFDDYKYNPIVLDEYVGEVMSVYHSIEKFKSNITKEEYIDLLRMDFKTR